MQVHVLKCRLHSFDLTGFQGWEKEGDLIRVIHSLLVDDAADQLGDLRTDISWMPGVLAITATCLSLRSAEIFLSTRYNWRLLGVFRQSQHSCAMKELKNSTILWRDR